MNAETLVGRLREIAQSSPERTAVEDASGRHSFGEVEARATRVALSLERRGLGRSTVGLLVSPGTPWVEALFGVWTASGTAVALSPSYPGPELRSLVDASGARAVLVSSDLEVAARAALPGTEILNVGAIAVEAGSGLPSSGVRAEDVALILFTSGTTGKPKGAKLTHENVRSLANALAEAWGFSSEDVLLHTLPLHHLHGIGVSLLVAVGAGACTRFVRFEPRAVWEELAHASVLMGVPTQHKKLFDAFDHADAQTAARWTAHGRKLRLVTSGSAALPESVGERWRRLSGTYPLERYGMTEIGIVLSNPLLEERRPGTVGRPLAGVKMRIVDEGGDDVAPGEPGELWIAARTVFSGYHDDALATERSFRGEWFKTGDTATCSEDGYVTILGRTSVDILKSGGYKLSALEIENALRLHEDVSDVAVVAVPDDTWGDLVVAAVEPKAGRIVSEEGLRAWAKERMAPYKVPKRVVAVPELPRNALGKVQKNLLVPLLGDRSLRDPVAK